MKPNIQKKTTVFRHPLAQNSSEIKRILIDIQTRLQRIEEQVGVPVSDQKPKVYYDLLEYCNAIEELLKKKQKAIR